MTDQPNWESYRAMSTDVEQLLAKAAQRKARAAELGASLSESSTPCDSRTGFLTPQIEKK